VRADLLRLVGHRRQAAASRARAAVQTAGSARPDGGRWRSVLAQDRPGVIELDLHDAALWRGGVLLHRWNRPRDPVLRRSARSRDSNGSPLGATLGGALRGAAGAVESPLSVQHAE